jgi:hypothetical protein
MEQSDLATLKKMQQEVGTHFAENLDHVAERLLRLRDGLKFEDVDWCRELEQHVATLDSASSFQPASEVEKYQLDTAVQKAVHQIARLISLKMT